MKAFFYFVPYGGNFGDELVPLIIRKLLPKKDLVFYKNVVPKNNKYKIMTSIGSILHLLPDNSYVWGTGHNPNKQKIPKNLNIFATRGPISMKYLNDNGYNLSHEKIAFGDPALLIPRLFPEWLEKTELKYDITFIPHHNDISLITQILTNKNINILYPNSGINNIIQTIKASAKIISSSLHGIILGEMLGKETSWIQLENSKKTETDQKYLDYYLSTNRNEIAPAQTFEQALNLKYIAPIYNDYILYESFYECLDSP